MKIDAESPGYFSMSEFPDEVIVSVQKRAEWQLEPDVTQSELGQEGVWYIAPEERDHVRLEPFSEDGEGEKGNWRSLLFRLLPLAEPQGRGVEEHRFLFRFWNKDVYVPRIESSLFILKRHEHKDDVTWELKTPKATLYGIKINGPSV